MSDETELDDLALAIADSFYAMEGGEGSAPKGPIPQDAELARHLIAAGYRRTPIHPNGSTA
jgi:hypothetical protein